jgi:predicted chitinase
MTNEAPTTLYVGTREAVIAEVGGLSHIYEGKYLIQPYGEANYDAVGVNTKKDLKGWVAEYKAAYPGIRVCYV